MSTDNQNPSSQLQMIPANNAIYVEGINQLLLGFPNSRITFYSLVEKQPSDNGSEIRHVACELIIPTAGLIEITQNIQAHIKTNAYLLEQAQADWLKKNDTVFKKLIE